MTLLWPTGPRETALTSIEGKDEDLQWDEPGVDVRRAPHLNKQHCGVRMSITVYWADCLSNQR